MMAEVVNFEEYVQGHKDASPPLPSSNANFELAAKTDLKWVRKVHHNGRQ